MPWVSDLQPVGRYPVNHIGAMLPSVIKYLVAERALNDVTSVFGPKLSELAAEWPTFERDSGRMILSDPLRSAAYSFCSQKVRRLGRA